MIAIPPTKILNEAGRLFPPPQQSRGEFRPGGHAATLRECALIIAPAPLWRSLNSTQKQRNTDVKAKHQRCSRRFPLLAWLSAYLQPNYYTHYKRFERFRKGRRDRHRQNTPSEETNKTTRNVPDTWQEQTKNQEPDWLIGFLAALPRLALSAFLSFHGQLPRAPI